MNRLQAQITVNLSREDRIGEINSKYVVFLVGVSQRPVSVSIMRFQEYLETDKDCADVLPVFYEAKRLVEVTEQTLMLPMLDQADRFREMKTDFDQYIEATRELIKQYDKEMAHTALKLNNQWHICC